jgi:hypothetical protein
MPPLERQPIGVRQSLEQRLLAGGVALNRPNCV